MSNEVSVRELKWALRSALPFAQLKDPSGRFDVVRLRTAGPNLVVSATDRFTAAWLRIRVLDPQPLDVWVSANTIKGALPGLSGDTAQIRTDSERIIIQHSGAEVSLPLREEPMPSLRHLELRCFAGELPDGGRRVIGLTVEFLRKLPRPDGVKSTALQFDMGDHVLLTDNSSAPCWAVAVAPYKLGRRTPEEIFKSHLNAWKDLS